jgi:hypothetical protein
MLQKIQIQGETDRWLDKEGTPAFQQEKLV